MSFNECDILMLKKWDDLVNELQVNPSLLSGWLACTFSSLDLLVKLRVSFISNEEGLIAVIPYFITIDRVFGFRMKTLELAGNLYSYHQDLICKGDVQFTFEYFLNNQMNINPWHVFRANGISRSNNASVAIRQLASKFGFILKSVDGERSPYLALPVKWSELVSQKKKKFRYKVNKREQELNENEKYSIKWYETLDDVRELTTIIYEIESASWKADTNMNIMNNPNEIKLYACLPLYLFENSMLFANVLYFEDTPIAYSLCYQYHKRVGQIKTSYNEKFREHSPGATLIDATIRTSIEKTHLEFDFLGDEMPHKVIWTKEVRPHENYLVYSKSALPYLLARIRGFKYLAINFLDKIANLYKKLKAKNTD